MSSEFRRRVDRICFWSESDFKVEFQKFFGSSESGLGNIFSRDTGAPVTGKMEIISTECAEISTEDEVIFADSFTVLCCLLIDSEFSTEPKIRTTASNKEDV
jgi:hypothetical protein